MGLNAVASPPLCDSICCLRKRVSGASAEHAILAQLGQAIRVRRIELGLSQEALTNHAGVDRSHMGEIERGERNVTLLNVERVANVLETLPSALLARAGF